MTPQPVESLTPREHIAEADRLLAEAAALGLNGGVSLAAVQAHATLALVKFVAEDFDDATGTA